MSRKSRSATWIALFAVGVVVGGYLFAESQPRSFLAVQECHDNCYRPEQLLGLLASAGIQRASTLLPFVARETDRCVAVRLPLSDDLVHYVIIPKKDIRDIADISIQDQPFVLDCLNVIGTIVRSDRLSDYRVITNGAGLQDVAYLHFHLVVEKKPE